MQEKTNRNTWTDEKGKTNPTFLCLDSEGIRHALISFWSISEQPSSLTLLGF